MKLYGKKFHLASMRAISWHVVVFSGKRWAYANSLSGPLKMALNLGFLQKGSVYSKASNLVLKVLKVVNVSSLW